MEPETGPPTAAIHTHGCKLNQADSESLARRFIEAGYRIVDWSDGADVLVLNTCTITATADAKARQALRRARRTNIGALVVATGCYAERDAEKLAAVEGVSLVLGNPGKEHLVASVTAALTQDKKKRLAPIDGFSDPTPPQGRNGANGIPVHFQFLPEEMQTGHATGRTRAMIKIQEGCDQVCAYCIVPKVRGRERSIQPEVLIAQIQEKIDLGCQEVVLTGTQLGTYGFDLKDTSLTQLLQRILRETEITRLRVSSVQPQEITEDLLEVWLDQRLCPHFHIPLQSGCDEILGAMRRRYTTSEFAAKVELIRSILPDAGITTDIIVGFPGEGREQYEESRNFAQSMNFSDMHIFPYSPRPGTSAVYLANRTPDNIKKARVAEMREVSLAGFRSFRLGQLGKHRPVLWESKSATEAEGSWTGLTDNYVRVRTQSGLELGNMVTDVRLLELVGESVVANVL